MLSVAGDLRDLDLLEYVVDSIRKGGLTIDRLFHRRLLRAAGRLGHKAMVHSAWRGLVAAATSSGTPPTSEDLSYLAIAADCVGDHSFFPLRREVYHEKT